MLGDAWEPEDWLEADDLGPLEDCPPVPDAVQIGWVWEPFSENGPQWLPYAAWREGRRLVEVTYDDGASVHYY